MSSVTLNKATAGGHDKPLSVRETAFVREYLVDLNGTAALRRLGLGSANPRQRAAELLARPHVQAAIQRAMDARSEAVEVTIERIAAEYSKLAFKPHEGPTLAGHKLQALEALGKYKGMFKPDAVTVVPVTFTFVGGPPLVTDDSLPPGATAMDQAVKPSVQSRSSALGVIKPTPR